MKFVLSIMTMLVCPAVSFVPSTKPVVKSFQYVGDIAPTQYFDPLGLSSEATEGAIKYLREAELHHGRVAMASFVALVGLDLFQSKLAVNYIYDMNFVDQLPFWFTVGAYEFARMGAGWKNPFVEENALFKLNDVYQPGNVLKMPANSYTEEDLNYELANGRLAMIGTLGYMAQELVQHSQVL